MWNESFISLFQKGGPIMWPLLFCSILALAIILERLIFFFRIRFNQQKFHQRLKALVTEGKVREAKAFSLSIGHPVAQTAAVYLDNLDQSDSLRQDLLRRDGSEQLQMVEKRLRTLSALAHLTPLIGLLGTVVGMVAAFATIEALAGAVNPGDLAGGIWEALLTTVFGLSIAIPCMAAFHGFESRADRIAREMQFMITTLDEWLGKQTEASLKATPVNQTEEELNTIS